MNTTGGKTHDPHRRRLPLFSWRIHRHLSRHRNWHNSASCNDRKEQCPLTKTHSTDGSRADAILAALYSSPAPNAANKLLSSLRQSTEQQPGHPKNVHADTSSVERKNTLMPTTPKAEQYDGILTMENRNKIQRAFRANHPNVTLRHKGQSITYTLTKAKNPRYILVKSKYPRIVAQVEREKNLPLTVDMESRNTEVKRWPRRKSK